MIHRKWSLLTGPPSILGGIVGAVVIAELLFGKTGDYLKSRPRKEEMASPNK